jgi:3-isopropylmalate dehydrogenase
VYNLAVFPGDGIGPEVVNEGLKVLEKIARISGIQYKTTTLPWSSQYYLDTGKLMTEDDIQSLRQYDAIYFGALGDPRMPPGLVERSMILNMRFGLDLYVNLRPIVLYSEHLCPLKDKKPEDIDFVVVRENTEDAYAGMGGFFKKGAPDEVAISEMIYTRKGVERIIRYAFETARSRNKKRKLTLVDKANALPAHDLWRRTFAEVAKEYPDITTEVAFVDATTMWFVKNPEWFDVIVTTNLFGDIITDLGAMIQGGLGIASSGNIHPGQVSMFEPIHGSAPKYTGLNVANPLAAIGAASMMLEFLGEKEAGEQITKAIRGLLESRRIPSLDATCGLSTTEIGDMVVAELRD